LKEKGEREKSASKTVESERYNKKGESANLNSMYTYVCKMRLTV